MRLSVPTNWDPELIEILKDYPVQDIYGVADKTIVGAGRPRWALSSVSRRQIEAQVKKIRASGKSFTYLLNAPCLNNAEYGRSTNRRIREYVKWIQGTGADFVSVTIPYLIEMITRDFPGLKVKASTIMHVNSVQRAKFLENMGVAEITADFMINRDLRLLQKMKSAVRPEITLILNDICLYQCPFRYYHYNVVGHSTQTADLQKGFYLDYCLTKCVPIRFGDLKELIKIRWIRPEDIAAYTSLGIDSFKISGRTHSTEWITRAVAAYVSGHYDGNLLDILDCMESHPGKGVPLTLRVRRKNFNLLGFVARLPFRFYKDYYAWYRAKDRISGAVYIDNRKLDGFIEFFKHNDCLSSCEECGNCGKWAAAVIRADREKLDRYVSGIAKLSHKMIS